MKGCEVFDSPRSGQTHLPTICRHHFPLSLRRLRSIAVHLSSSEKERKEGRKEGEMTPTNHTSILGIIGAGRKTDTECTALAIRHSYIASSNLKKEIHSSAYVNVLVQPGGIARWDDKLVFDRKQKSAAGWRSRWSEKSERSTYPAAIRARSLLSLPSEPRVSQTERGGGRKGQKMRDLYDGRTGRYRAKLLLTATRATRLICVCTRTHHR